MVSANLQHVSVTLGSMRRNNTVTSHGQVPSAPWVKAQPEHPRDAVRISKPVYRVALVALLTLLIVSGAVYLALPVSFDRSVLAEMVEDRNNWLSTLFLALTNTFTPTNIVLLSAATSLALWLIGKSRWQAAQVLAAVGASSIAAQLIKHLVGRSRPALSSQLVHETDLSFPSGHATGIVALVTSLALVILWRKGYRSLLGLIEVGTLSVLAFLICCSRVYVGAHWATDVCAGVLLGFGTTVVVFAALASFARRFRPQS